jgi:hypothetical protein
MYWFLAFLGSSFKGWGHYCALAGLVKQFRTIGRRDYLVLEEARRESAARTEMTKAK